MKMLEKNGWSVTGNRLSLSTFNHFINIDTMNNILSLTIEEKILYYQFMRLEDAITFAEDVIALAKTEKEIDKAYYSFYNTDKEIANPVTKKRKTN